MRVIKQGTLVALAFAIYCGSVAAAPLTLKTLYSFAGAQDGADPRALVYSDGQLYGITHHSGSSSCFGSGCGTVFRIDPRTGQEMQLYAFQGAPNDGSYDLSGITRHAGVLYGATSTGGQWNLGTVYEFDLATRQERVIYSFRGYPTDGAYPAGTLTFIDDVLYGTTMAGGAGCEPSGCGTVFKIDVKSAAESIIYSFKGGGDGASPAAGVIYRYGALYGTTEGGDVASDYGTVFRLGLFPERLDERTLYAFKGGSDGAYPIAPLLHWRGALFGSTQGGDTAADHGTVFKLDYKDGGATYVELYRFKGGNDGALPAAALISGDGKLYGTTTLGGAAAARALGYGTIFAIDPESRSETTLYRFKGGEDGKYPETPLLLHASAFYGTTSFGGEKCNAEGCGTVFRLSK